MTEVKLDRINIVQKQESNGSSDIGLTNPSSASQSSRSIGDYESISGPISYNNFSKDPEFAAIVREAEIALDLGLKPKLSSKGTSGCYFITDRHEVLMHLCIQFFFF